MRLCSSHNWIRDLDDINAGISIYSTPPQTGCLIWGLGGPHPKVRAMNVSEGSPCECLVRGLQGWMKRLAYCGHAAVGGIKEWWGTDVGSDRTTGEPETRGQGHLWRTQPRQDSDVGTDLVASATPSFRTPRPMAVIPGPISPMALQWGLPREHLVVFRQPPGDLQSSFGGIGGTYEPMGRHAAPADSWALVRRWFPTT